MQLGILRQRCGPAIGTLCIACLGFIQTSAAQQPTRFGDGTLDISVQFPQEVRSGQQFSFPIMVRNSTDNVTLHDIKLRMTEAKGFNIESTSMQGQQQGQQDQQAATSSDNQQGTSQSGGKNNLMISQLEPGQSQTIMVKAAADEEGELKTCLQVISYLPSLCMTSKVVKPELEIVKTAPERVNRCDEIVIEYSVKNAGTGALGKFQISDDLGNKMMTIEGNKELSFPVDGLEAGEVRRFQARVFAMEPGSISSRAVAKATDADISARSKRTTTEVVAADLKVDIEGPGIVYNEQNATFMASVTNIGNAPAEGVEVTVMWPEQGSLADLGEPRMQTNSQTDGSQADNGNQANRQSNANTNNRPTEVSLVSEQANADQQQGSQQQASQQQTQKMRSESFTIPRLEPNQTAKFPLVIQPRDLEEITTRIEASYVCAVDSARDQEQAQAKTTAMASTQAQVKRLAALQIYTIDTADPVRVGEEVTYVIRVLNEGRKADSQVELTALLPENLEFKNVEGPTEAEANGKEISFGSIEKLKPGEEVEYRLVAVSKEAGDIRFGVELKSDSLDQPVTSEEPTRVFGSK